MVLQKPIDMLPGTSPVTIKRLKSLGVNTFDDLLHYYPFRYDDFSLASPIATLQEGERVSVRGIIVDIKNQYTRSRLTIQKVTIQDLRGDRFVLTWYNQPYLLRVLHLGQELAAAGVVERFAGRLSLSPTEWELVRNEMVHTGRIVPVYSETRGLSSKTIREKIHYLLSELRKEDEPQEILPAASLKSRGLMPLKQALMAIHFPQDAKELSASKRRLAFDELLVVQLISQLTRQQWRQRKVKHRFDITDSISQELNGFIRQLPFELTPDQMLAVRDILSDFDSSSPMNRFLQGDVGSGKTVVAAIATYASYLCGYQSLIMAPTEILANQHYQTFEKLFKNSKLRIALQTGSNKMISKQGKYDIVIGTHALLSQSLSFQNIGLVVIDEQHRFGVTQRALLKEKGGEPHLLTMTATPIPRTLALALYGELDVSSIRQMPKGRIPVKSYLVPQAKREAAYDWIKGKIRAEHCQVFVICPLIEESDAETLQSAKAAKKEYEILKKVFPDFNVELIHGKLRAKEKNRIMKEFEKGETDILVSTSLVEVGIDIPNASIMVIEGADRYGMAQLHQLRGRIGRGNVQAYCCLFTDSQDEEVTSRLSFFSKTVSGQELAEYDMRRRGPGNIFGTHQHGYLKLKAASLSDIPLILETKKEAETLIAKSSDLGLFPQLKSAIDIFTLKSASLD